MMRRYSFLIFILMVLDSDATAGWFFGPSNSEECIAENIKKTSSEVGASAIAMACKGLYPGRKYKTYEQCITIEKHEKAVREQKQGYAEDKLIDAFIGPEAVCERYFPDDKTKQYYRCILRNMRGVTTDNAANAIAYGCRK